MQALVMMPRRLFLVSNAGAVGDATCFDLGLAVISNDLYS